MSSDQSSFETSKNTANSSSHLEHLQHKNDGERKDDNLQSLKFPNSTIGLDKGDNDDSDGNPPSKRAKVDFSGNEVYPLEPANNNNNSSKGTLLLTSNSNNNKVSNNGNSSNNASASAATNLLMENSGEMGETSSTTTATDTTTQRLFPPAVIRSRENSSDRDEIKEKTQETNINNSNLDSKSVSSQVRWRGKYIREYITIFPPLFDLKLKKKILC